MIKRLFLTTMIVTAGIIVSSAANIDGKWKASFEGMGGNMELIFTFKVDGQNLTGTVSSQMEIKNGKVNGNEFSFDIDTGMGDPIKHNCKLEGDVIKMKIEMGDMGGGQGPGEITLTKVED